MLNAVILGYGTVGKATADCFNIERYYSRTEKNIGLEEIAKSRYIFVCLPTPVKEGVYQTDELTKLIKEILLYPMAQEAIFIIRSTVNPGYNRFLQSSLGLKYVVSNPEFLSEDTAIEDANNPDYIVIGSDDVQAREALLGLYRGRFKHCQPLLTDSITAELIKLSLNAFFATKIVFANEVFDYAQKLGANYTTVQKVLETHRWGSRNHFTIFHKGGRGAGGKCLKKDIEGMAGHSGSLLFEAVVKLNNDLLRSSNKT